MRKDCSTCKFKSKSPLYSHIRCHHCFYYNIWKPNEELLSKNKLELDKLRHEVQALMSLCGDAAEFIEDAHILEHSTEFNINDLVAKLQHASENGIQK